MIQNLLFDLGGVIMDIKKDNCVEAYKLLGFKDIQKFLDEYGQKGAFGDLEAGRITVDEFHAFVHQYVPEYVTDKEIDDAFMKFLIGIPVERLRQLQLLRQRYRLYLLSNTNPIMWDAKIADEFRKDGLCREAYFDGGVTSFEAKCMKPAPGIFHYAEQQLGIKPEETLFLDDSLANVQAAIDLGFRAAHVPDGKEFYDILKELNLA